MAVCKLTRNLITLEAEDAVLRWEEAAEQAAKAKEAADSGDKGAARLGTDFAAGLEVRAQDVLAARVLASQARARYDEYVSNQLLALADLERITAGVFAPGLVKATNPTPAAPKGHAGEKDKDDRKKKEGE